MFNDIAERVNNRRHYNELNSLMKHYGIPAPDKAQMISVIRKNSMWIEKNWPIIDDFLRAFFNSGGRTGLPWMIVLL
jgi:hypothetical protein